MHICIYWLAFECIAAYCILLHVARTSYGTQTHTHHKTFIVPMVYDKRASIQHSTRHLANLGAPSGAYRYIGHHVGMRQTQWAMGDFSVLAISPRQCTAHECDMRPQFLAFTIAIGSGIFFVFYSLFVVVYMCCVLNSQWKCSSFLKRINFASWLVEVLCTDEKIELQISTISVYGDV